MEDKQFREKGFLNTFEAAEMLGLSPATFVRGGRWARGRGSTSSTARCSTRRRTSRRGFQSTSSWSSRKTKEVDSWAKIKTTSKLVVCSDPRGVRTC